MHVCAYVCGWVGEVYEFRDSSLSSQSPITANSPEPHQSKFGADIFEHENTVLIAKEQQL